jgi:hypothetical protein
MASDEPGAVRAVGPLVPFARPPALTYAYLRHRWGTSSEGDSVGRTASVPRKRSKRHRATAAGVSLETLEATPERAFRFLLGVGRSALVRDALEQHGFDAAERKRGIQLLDRLLSFELEDELEQEKGDVIQAIDDWDETGFELVRMAFLRFPVIRDRVLRGLGPSTGTAAVLAVSTLLDRLTELEGSAEGRAALAHLATRGVDEAVRRRLLDLVKTAQEIPDEPPSPVPDAHEATLVELRAWYEEWAGFAKLVIKRRDLLVRLGLAAPRDTDDAG